MSEPAMERHSTAWEDEGGAGVQCWVKTTTHPRLQNQQPTDGGTIWAHDDNFACDSCGQRLRLKWSVRLVEVSDKKSTAAQGGEAS